MVALLDGDDCAEPAMGVLGDFGGEVFFIEGGELFESFNIRITLAAQRVGDKVVKVQLEVLRDVEERVVDVVTRVKVVLLSVGEGVGIVVVKEGSVCVCLIGIVDEGGIDVGTRWVLEADVRALGLFWFLGRF